MITPAYFTLAIIMMALITFSVRYIFFTTTFNIKLHPLMQKVLHFTAPCILTAMLIPIVFQGALKTSGNFNFYALINSSYFWAGLLAMGLSFIIRHTLLVIIISMIAFYGLRYCGLN